MSSFFEQFYKGEVRVGTTLDGLHAVVHNTYMYDAACVMAQLARGDTRYALKHFYIEFANVEDPEDEPVVPIIDRAAGVSYYQSLSSSADTDFLRVPILLSAESNSDTALYTLPNQITYYAQSAGAVGIHGETFSSGATSKVYGGALVASPVDGDWTQDLVFARFYLPTEKQLVKPAGGEVVVSWKARFT